MSAFLTLTEREIVRFYRQRSRVIGAFLTPLLFWFVIGAGIGSSFDGGVTTDPAIHIDYLRWFYPGVLVMIVLFTAIFSTISVIDDRREGFLQSVLAAPISRLTVAGGKLAGGSILALAQAALFLLLAPIGHVPLSLTGSLAALGALAVLALALTGLGFFIAWLMESTQGFHAIMNLVLLPLWMLSGSAFPIDGAAGWLRTVMMANPVTYGVALVRRLLDPEAAAATVGLPGIGISWVVTIAFAVVMITAASLVTMRRGKIAP
ncbi:MAG: ABC transporter permease [Candidatus Eisenbacteria bacterium]|nr:ABC transporter permease [Candidatus Eisenbacteria bacterium]